MKKFSETFFKILKGFFTFIFELIIGIFLLLFYYSIFGIVAVFYRLLNPIYKKEKSTWLKSKIVSQGLKDFESEG
ncbi:MAG: hypothetical protein ABDH37_03355 [Candidatus Hydrothermales bacterium]